jgi:hypothetical protein
LDNRILAAASRPINCLHAYFLKAAMAVVTNSEGALAVKAYIGDANTLLAFNLTKKSAKGARRI